MDQHGEHPPVELVLKSVAFPETEVELGGAFAVFLIVTSPRGAAAMPEVAWCRHSSSRHAVNRYRNSEGTGHGRPQPSNATSRDARVASRIAGAVSELLLDALEPPSVSRAS